jgi:signal-transduction protein with cAMP-binding, CBS, and nucleotidyltransferase domain
MRVEDIMAVGALTIPRSETVEAAAKLMRDQSVGMLIVGDEDHVDGVVSDRDLLVRCVAVGETPTTAKVEDCMSPDVITIGPDTDPFQAASIMRIQMFHRLPVVDNGRAIGVISLTDIAQAMDEPLHDLLIGSNAARRIAKSTFIGMVKHYFNHIGVAAISLQSPLHKNDVVHFVGHTTNLKQVVSSMEIDHQQVDAAYSGDDVAMKVNERVRTSDFIYQEISS